MSLSLQLNGNGLNNEQLFMLPFLIPLSKKDMYFVKLKNEEEDENNCRVSINKCFRHVPM
jgi:hypothetical protein